MTSAATSTAPRFAHGVMTISLDGEDVELFANVRASRTICRLYGGLNQAFTNTNAPEFSFAFGVTDYIDECHQRISHSWSKWR